MAKKDLIVTDAGTMIYPHLTKPDTKFNKDGVYHVKLNVAESEKTSALRQAITDGAAKALADAKEANKGKKVEKGKKAPKLALCDDMPFTEDEDGTTTFTFKMIAHGKDKEGKAFTRKPSIFDAKGTPITKELKIGGGTLSKISFALDPFYSPQLGAGVTLRLYGVQILKLVEWGTRSAESLGFEAEDGFSAEDVSGDDDAGDSGESVDSGEPDEDEGTNSLAGSEGDDF